MHPPSNGNERDKYFIHFLKYEQCIYVVSILGAVSQLILSAFLFAHLILGISFPTDEMTRSGITYSYLAIFFLIGTAFSEILLMRAVQQRVLRYIQWWMFSSFIFLLISILLTVIIAFTLFLNGLWITISFIYLIIRVPVQMYFVDCFAQAEILHREPHPHQSFKSVLYRKFP